MIARLLNAIKSLRKEQLTESPDLKIMNESNKKSKEAMLSTWHEDHQSARLEYISMSKVRILCDDLGMPFPESTITTEKSHRIGTEAEIGHPALLIKAKGNSSNKTRNITSHVHSNALFASEVTKALLKSPMITPIEDASPGNYILVRYPLFFGQVRLRMARDELEWAVWWQGTYRGTEMFLCGSINNLRDKNARVNVLWDPSSSDEARKLFAALNRTVKEGGRFSTIDFNSLCDGHGIYSALSDINDGTRRGYREGDKPGWRDILLRCDCVDYGEDGSKIIFGSPVWITNPGHPSYGWYPISGPGSIHHKPYYYGEWDNNSWTGRTVCCEGTPSHLRIANSQEAIPLLPKEPNISHIKAQMITTKARYDMCHGDA